MTDRPLAGHGLSELFDPLLDHFVEETRRVGGRVEIWGEMAAPRGLLIEIPAERAGSIFTRDREVADELMRSASAKVVFSEFELTPVSEVYDVLVSMLPGAVPRHPFVHRIRRAEPADLPAVAELVQESYGAVDPRWLLSMDGRTEAAMIAEVGDRIAGAAWVCTSGGWGRLHSVTVRPRFRGLGIGRDLWAARAMWAEGAGAHGLITEISVENPASRAIATAAGMRPVGRLYANLRA